LVLWIGESEIQEGIVKIKNLNKHEEYILKREELTERIHEIVRDNPILLPQAL
jgi:histidyl-tRNA synthetase